MHKDVEPEYFDSPELEAVPQQAEPIDVEEDIIPSILIDILTTLEDIRFILSNKPNAGVTLEAKGARKSDGVDGERVS